MSESPLHLAAELMIMFAVVVFAAKIGGEIAERWLKIPAVLGELGAGIIISPFALGGVDFGIIGPIFHPVIEALQNPELSKKTAKLPFEIYFVGQLAAIILLFEAGLETNRQQFVRYIKPATAVAMGGVLVPFALGMLVTIWFGYANFSSISELLPALFVGAILTATSVGITARVLADIGEIDSIEGVTVLASAVVDDVLGIIILAVVVGIHEQGSVTASGVSAIFLKAVGFWLGLTVFGSILARYISAFAVFFKSAGATLSISIALGLLAAGIAEVYFGLAMIIGAYSIGLAMSETDLKHRIEGPMRSVGYFLIPVFFTVVGMQVNLGAFVDSDHLGRTALFATALTIAAIVSKLLGSGLPALAVGFDRIGAQRVAWGMLPRGEVALIVADIGFESGVIGGEIFAVAIIMTIITTVMAPVFLIRSFRPAAKPSTPETSSS